MVLLPTTPILGVAELESLLKRMQESGEESPEWAKGLTQATVETMIENARKDGRMNQNDASKKAFVGADKDGNLIRAEDENVELEPMKQKDVLEAYENTKRIEKSIRRQIKEINSRPPVPGTTRPKRISSRNKRAIINNAYQEVLGKNAPDINKWTGTTVTDGFSVQSPSRNGESFYYRYDDLDPKFHLDKGGSPNSEKRFKVGKEYRFFPIAAIAYSREPLEEYAKNLRAEGFLARITTIDADKARGTKRFGLYVHPKGDNQLKLAYGLGRTYEADPTNPQFGNIMRKWLVENRLGKLLAPDQPNLILEEGTPDRANIWGEGNLNNRVRLYNRRINGKTFRKLDKTPKNKSTQKAVANRLRSLGYNARVIPVKGGYHVFYRARPGTRALLFDAPQYANRWRE